MPLAATIIAMAGLALIAIGPPGPRPVRPTATVEGPGFRFSPASVALPPDETLFPDDPQTAILNRTCLACHSAEMILTQPPLEREQWEAIVHKMRETYKAPLDDRDIPAILRALGRISADAAAR